MGTLGGGTSGEPLVLPGLELLSLPARQPVVARCPDGHFGHLFVVHCHGERGGPVSGPTHFRHGPSCDGGSRARIQDATLGTGPRPPRRRSARPTSPAIA